jgi:glucose/arabinose dehydrogenase
MRALLGVLALALAAPAAPAPALAAADLAWSPVTARQQAAQKADATRRAMPDLQVRRQVRGLDVPWDVKVVGDGRLLITQRDRASLVTWRNGNKRRVGFPSSKIWVSGETGLMSLEVDPRFAENRRFYTCSGWQKKGGGHDVRVNAWRLNDDATKARFVETLIGGFPTSSGRHGGCRLLITRNGSLLVGTGDAAQGTNPRNLRSLGGKTLRLDRMTGKPWPGNKFADADNRKKRYVHTYGHRNVQGLAQRKDGSLWSAEHGPSRDDEVNRLKDGGDYGWHPVPGYNEGVPMTDHSLPGKQVGARWSSGSPTRATSGAAWVYGREWGRLDGTLAVAALAGNRVIFMKFDKAGKLRWTRTPNQLQQFGRLRSVTRAPNGDLLITTANGGGNDAVLRVSPR